MNWKGKSDGPSLQYVTFAVQHICEVHSDIINSKRITGQKPFFKGRKGSNSIENGRILPINNPIPLIPNNNMYAKFEKNSVHKYSSYRSETVSTDG